MAETCEQISTSTAHRRSIVSAQYPAAESLSACTVVTGAIVKRADLVRQSTVVDCLPKSSKALVAYYRFRADELAPSLPLGCDLVLHNNVFVILSIITVCAVVSSMHISARLFLPVGLLSNIYTRD